MNIYNPMPPDILANALEDPIHYDIGRSRPAKTVRTSKSLDEKYADISKIIAEKVDKNWLKNLQDEDDILVACVKLCEKDKLK